MADLDVKLIAAADVAPDFLTRAASPLPSAGLRLKDPLLLSWAELSFGGCRWGLPLSEENSAFLGRR